MTHGLRDLGLQLLVVLAEIAHERVAENHYLVGHAAAAEEAPAARLKADVLAVGVVRGAAIGDHNRDVPQRVLKLLRQFVERRADESLEFLLARVPLADLGPPWYASVIGAPAPRVRRCSMQLQPRHSFARRLERSRQASKAVLRRRLGDGGTHLAGIYRPRSLSRESATSQPVAIRRSGYCVTSGSQKPD